MRLLYVALVIAMAAVLVALGCGGAIAAGLSADGPPFFLAVVAMILLTLPPIALGGFVQWWPVEPWRGTGRRDLVRMLAASIVVQAVGGALVLLLATDTTLPLWQPVALLAAVAVVTAVNVSAAVAVRRRDALRPPDPTGEWSPQLVARKVRTVRLWAFGTLLLAGAGITALVVATGAVSPREVGVYGLLAVSVACIVASAACLVVTWPLVRRLREEAADAEPRALTRALLSGAALPPGDRTIRYARVLTSYLPFQVAQVTLLWAGLLLAQLPSTIFAEGPADPASVVVLVVLLVAYATFLPLPLRLHGRARRYAAEHEDVLAPN